MDELSYSEIILRLKESFPNGTVKFRSDNNKAYIPNQIYTDRLEAATQGKWNKSIKDIEINLEHLYVKVIVTVTIGDHSRDGYGLAYIDSDSKGRPKISNTLDQAAASAFVDALDTWQMGWRDLAPHNKMDWGGNPGIRHLLDSDPSIDGQNQERKANPNHKVERKCIMAGCHKTLSADEWDLLKQVPNLNRNKMVYCFEHLPDHYKRKIPEQYLKAFLRE